MMDILMAFWSFFKRCFDWFHSFGTSHFTVMLIPHSEKKIFSFQINNYIIMSFMGVLTLSLLGIWYHYQTRQSLLADLNQVIEADASYWEKQKKLSKLIEDSEFYFDNLNHELKDIFNIIGKKNNSSRPRQDESLLSKILKEQDRAFFKKHNIEHVLPKSLRSLISLEEDMDHSLRQFDEIKETLEARKKVLGYIPNKWPIHRGQGYKTSAYGKRRSPFNRDKYEFHTGVDIGAPPRTPIVASGDGWVRFSGTKHGYGKVVIIRHKYGYETLYAHNYKNLVKVRQKVKKGQKIALLGNTGRSTGYHIHFEIRIDGVALDPWPFITVEL